MDIKNWKEHPKVLELRAKLDDRKTRGILKPGLSDHRDTCVCSSCGIDDVSDCDNAGEFYGTDDLRRRPFFCK